MVKEATPATENTQVAKREVGAISGLEGFSQFKSKGPITGLEDLSSEDIKMPKIKLTQPTSAEVTDEKCKAGEFFNVTTGEAYEKLECQLLAFGKSRVRWPETFKRGDDPICRSFDGVISDTTGEHCAQCPYKDWTDGERPDCSQVYVWMGLLPNGSPFRMMISGAQISKCKDFLTEVSRNGYPAFIYQMSLESEKQKNEKGTYYTINFNFQRNADGTYKTINPAEFKKYEDLTLSLQQLFNKVRATDLVSGDTEHNNADNEGIF